jgi:hypothetical protein
MEWSKHKFEPTDLNKLCSDYLKVIKKGEADLSHCYCVWKYQDDTIMYFNSIYDFVMNYPNIIATAPIIKFYLYQPKYQKST